MALDRIAAALVRAGPGSPASIRHPRRRHRSRLPAPRERNRAIALCLQHAANGEFLDAQRLFAGRRREDEQERREFPYNSRLTPKLVWFSASASNAVDPLSAAHRLDD